MTLNKAVKSKSVSKKSAVKKVAAPKKTLGKNVDKTFDQPIESAFSNMSERLVKIQHDLIMPAITFQREGVQNTITVFGASRIKTPAEAQKMLADLKKKAKAKPSPALKEKIKEAERAVKMSKYYELCEELCRRLQEWINLKNFPKNEEYYIMTGGGPGIMEAANKGAFRAGGRTVGLTITIPDEQRQNDYVSPELGIHFNYFLMRKFWLLFFAKAIVVFPGGTGTFDEFFEVFTLMKTRKTHEYIPVVLFGREFWESVVGFKALVESDVITEADLNFFRFAETVDEAFDFITSEIERLYLKK
jgi:Predicted Rossmann fold nucleotide-binding protein